METSGEDEREIVLPLYAEEISVSKRVEATNRIQVSTVTHAHEELVEALLAREEAQVERVAVGRPVDAVPPVREEGDTIVIPVVEEILLAERRLMLKEEVRIRRVRQTIRSQERVILRKQEAVVTRTPVERREAAGGAAERSEEKSKR